MYRIGRTGRAEPHVVPKRAVALALVERVEGVAAQTLSRHGSGFGMESILYENRFNFFIYIKNRVRTPFCSLTIGRQVIR
jgi:hypothetical protein